MDTPLTMAALCITILVAYVLVSDSNKKLSDEATVISMLVIPLVTIAALLYVLSTT